MAQPKASTTIDAIPQVPTTDAKGNTTTKDVVKRNKVLAPGSIDRVDSSWVRSSFMISADDLNSVEEKYNLYFSSARYKFTDTRPGGNLGINSKYQFTRYSDIRDSGRLFGRNEVTTNSVSGNYGMGRYYSEAIDDPEQTIYLEFGVAKFASMLHFLTAAFDSNSPFTANTGRSSIFGTLGSILGTITAVAAFPVLSIALWVTGLAKKVLPGASSQYYTVKPTMHLYWAMVNGLLTDIAINLGVFPAGLAPPGKNPEKYGTELKLNDSQFDMLSSMFPEIFTSKHHIDVFAIANRAQVLAQQQAHEEFKLYTSGSEDDLKNYFNYYGQGKVKAKEHNGSFSAYINDLFSISNSFDRDYGKPKTSDVTTKDKKVKSLSTIDKDTSIVDQPGDIISSAEELLTQLKDGFIRVSENYTKSAGKYFDANVRDGSAFAIFKVEYTGTTTESFSNSTKEAGIKSTLNGASSTARTIKFNAFGGNILGDVVGDVVGGAVDFVTNYASSVTFGLSNIVAGLLGGGYIDVPKQWSDSSISLSKNSYKMKLISPYGNTMSSLLDIFMPLSMILAGSVPIATGKTSYTSPFLCRLFDRGRQKITTGIIDSVTITRGDSNLGYTLDGRALSMEISFTVLDLSSVMSMPISDNGVFGLNLHLDEDHMLPRYIATITGRDLYSQRYALPNTMYKLALAKAQFDSFTPARIGDYLGSGTVGSILSSLAVSGNQIIPR